MGSHAYANEKPSYERMQSTLRLSDVLDTGKRQTSFSRIFPACLIRHRWSLSPGDLATDKKPESCTTRVCGGSTHEVCMSNFLRIARNSSSVLRRSASSRICRSESLESRSPQIPFMSYTFMYDGSTVAKRK